MQGKTVVATGATSGIGAAAVEALARKGARVVFVARDASRADATLAKLKAAVPGLDHRAFFADLSQIGETKRVGAEIAAVAPKIDALINNAGAIFTDRLITAEGLEMTFALNHMSYFTLTQTLLDNLKAAGAARIVSTSSAAHLRGRIDIDDLQSQRGYSGYRVYGASKLANILFTRELARRLAGSGVTANCLHPGVVATRFGESAEGWFRFAIRLARRIMVTPEQGAETIVYLASSPEVAGVSGRYFARCKPARTSTVAQDDALAAKLWAASEALYAAN